MYEYNCVITSVHDGDTFRADVDLGFDIWVKDEAFRLNRINAPELIKADPRGQQARDFLRNLLPVGAQVVIRTEKDKREKYGRMLAEVWLGGTKLVSDFLVEAGFAKYWDGTGARPV